MAADPKMTRELRCPVRPNGRRSIMAASYGVFGAPRRGTFPRRCHGTSGVVGRVGLSPNPQGKRGFLHFRWLAPVSTMSSCKRSRGGLVKGPSKTAPVVKFKGGHEELLALQSGPVRRRRPVVVGARDLRFHAGDRIGSRSRAPWRSVHDRCRDKPAE